MIAVDCGWIVHATTCATSSQTGRSWPTYSSSASRPGAFWAVQPRRRTLPDASDRAPPAEPNIYSFAPTGNPELVTPSIDTLVRLESTATNGSPPQVPACASSRLRPPISPMPSRPPAPPVVRGHTEVTLKYKSSSGPQTPASSPRPSSLARTTSALMCDTAMPGLFTCDAGTGIAITSPKLTTRTSLPKYASRQTLAVSSSGSSNPALTCSRPFAWPPGNPSFFSSSSSVISGRKSPVGSGSRTTLRQTRLASFIRTGPPSPGFDTSTLSPSASSDPPRSDFPFDSFPFRLLSSPLDDQCV